jgi:hypothetical protein
VYVPVCNLHFCLPPWFLNTIWHEVKGVGAYQNSLRWVTGNCTTRVFMCGLDSCRYDYLMQISKKG